MPAKETTETRQSYTRTLLLPAIALLVAAGVTVTALLFIAADGADRQALARQTQAITLALENIRLELALEQNHAGFDVAGAASRQQASQSLAQVLVERMGYRAVAFVAGGYDVQVTPPQAVPALFAGELADVGRQLRATVPTGSNQPLHPGMTRYASLADAPVLLVATPFPQSAETVVVGVVPLDETLALETARGGLAEAGRFVASRTADSQWSSVPLEAADGRAVGYFEWQPDRPGTGLLAHATPALLAAFLVCALLVAALVGRLVQAARATEDSHARALYAARHDHLTGLPNRAALTAHISDLLVQRGSRRLPLNVLLLDLDRFKQINDTQGHQAGDELLLAVSQRLRAALGQEQFLARIGGDEFAVVAALGTDNIGAPFLSRTIFEAFAEPVAIGRNPMHIGTSIGIVSDTAGEATAGDLLRKADIALHRAKAAGRNRSVVYEEQMNEQLQLERTIEAELRDALRLGEQLSVQFQPLVDQKTRKVIGAEALARWHHPRFGQISPGRFIPVAEATGLIESLGQFVLREACRVGAAAKGRTIAVNISTTQLRNPGFAEEVLDTLHETGMRADDLEIEITESILLDEEHISSRNLMTLRAAGIHVALDDFGTGYSSLSYLHRYPVDRIKIDRSFVSPLAEGEQSVAVARALVTVAHAMNLDVTAEGVETEKQAAILSKMGCNTFQGFLFSPSVGADRILEIFQSEGKASPPRASARGRS